MSGGRGYISMITASSWMFISSFEKFRKTLLSGGSICSMIQQSTHGYAGVTVPTTMFVYACGRPGVMGSYIRLTEFDRPQWQEPRALQALADPDCGWFYRMDARSFEAVPGSPIAYWASEAIVAAFSNPALGSITETHLGMATCDNERYLRLWFEVSNRLRANPSSFPYQSTFVWFPYNKGGLFRKWYGNDEYLVNWKDDGTELKRSRAVIVESSLNYRPMISWSRVSSAVLAVRYKPAGYLFDMTGPAAFGPDNRLFESMAFLNSSTGKHVSKFLSATIDFQPGQIAKYPLSPEIKDDEGVNKLVRDCIGLSRQDWNSLETSWGFSRHPLA